MIEHKCLSPWKGAMIGALVSFAVSSASWMALPFHEMTLKVWENEPVVDVVAANAKEAGVYLSRHDSGGLPVRPFVFVVYEPKGWGSMGLSMLLYMVISGVGGFYWTWVLGKIPGLTLKDAAKYGAMFGFSVGMLGQMPNWVWWKFPLPFTLLYVVDAVVVWTVASPLIARFGQAAVCELPKRG